MIITINGQAISIETYHDLIKAKQQHPESQVQLMEHLFKEEGEFLRLIPTKSALTIAVREFEEYHDQFFHCLVMVPGALKQLLPTAADFINTANYYRITGSSEQLKQLSWYLFASPGEYERLVRGERSYYCMAKIFVTDAKVLVDRLLTVPGEFKRINLSRTYLSHLFGLPHIFQHAPAFMDYFIDNPEEFKKFITADAESYLWAVLAFPKYAEQLIAPLLSSPEEFRRLIPSFENYKIIVWVLRNYSEQFISHLFQVPGEFDYLVETIQDLSLIVKLFSGYKDKFAEQFFQIPRALARFVETQEDLATIKEIFPNHLDKVADSLFESPEKFNCLITSKADIPKMARLFPKHLAQLADYLFLTPKKLGQLVHNEADFFNMAKIFYPNHLTLFSKYVYNNAKAFERVIKPTFYLQQPAALYKDHAEQFMTYLFKSQSSYSRVIPTSNILTETINVFPQYESQIRERWEFIQRQKIAPTGMACMPWIRQPRWQSEFTVINDMPVSEIRAAASPSSRINTPHQ